MLCEGSNVRAQIKRLPGFARRSVHLELLHTLFGSRKTSTRAEEPIFSFRAWGSIRAASYKSSAARDRGSGGLHPLSSIRPPILIVMLIVAPPSRGTDMATLSVFFARLPTASAEWLGTRNEALAAILGGHTHPGSSGCLASSRCR
jgi:hypothetical protein